MLQADSEDDISWTPLEWRHLQSVVDESGGQACRFELLSSILNHPAQAGMDSETLVPYGHQFADSDFIDSIWVNEPSPYRLPDSSADHLQLPGNQYSYFFLPSSKRLVARYQAGYRPDAAAVQ